MGSRVRETNVIDNKRVSLRDQLMDILPRTKSANIAVGYFFISGLAVIIEPLQKVDKLRLLISNTTNRETEEALIESGKSIKQVRSEIKRWGHVHDDRKQKIQEDSVAHLSRSLEYMSQTPDEHDVVQTLISMINEKKIEVRIYPKEKLHAKAYIFELRDTEVAAGIGIVGSSNLSLSGITVNSELNLKTLDDTDVNKLLEWFDLLWEDGVDFIDRFGEILKRSWAGRVYTPNEIFLKGVYHEHKNRVAPKHGFDLVWGGKSPELFPFQRQAVDRCITMIEKHGGAIVSDVVGLGKTYVGTAVLKYLQRYDYRPLIVCPPALVGMWKDFCNEYKVAAKILSMGKLAREKDDLALNFEYLDRNLVLIDESHHFKNNNSRRYEALQHFMHTKGAHAILLTATPYSNDANDIKNQIMLFHTSPKTTIPPANVTDLNTFFKSVEKGDANLVDLLQNIMIRRTRKYVLAQWGKTDENNPNRRYLLMDDNQRKYFPTREMKTCRYNINQSYCKKYDDIANLLTKSCLTLARYSPGLYLRASYQKIEPYSDLKTTGPKLVMLIRIFLLKRMDSSISAFRDSVEQSIKTHQLFLESMRNNFIPVGELASVELSKAAHSATDLDYDPEIQQIVERIRKKSKNLYKPTAFYMERLQEDVHSDLETFKKIRQMLSTLTSGTDDKLHRLQQLLNSNKNKKIMIFTEFESTANYLYENLEWNNSENVELVTSKRKNILHAARRFDPKNNPSLNNQLDNKKELTLLISTDVLSEGVNLQAGNIVINYDVHWNPVRLIQRVGRVDRIGSDNEHITVYNFLPFSKIENDLKLEAIVSSKIRQIHKLIGEDSAILDESETINEQNMYVIYKNQDSSILDNEGNNPLDPTEFEQLLIDIHENNPKLWKKLSEIPGGVRSSKNPRKDGKLLLACSNGFSENNPFTNYYVIDHNKKVIQVDSREALSLLNSNDKTVHALPGDYDSMLDAGWKKFLYDMEQREAGAKIRSKITTLQTSITNRLAKIMLSAAHIKNKEMAETLYEAFSTPVLKSKLTKKLVLIRNAKLDDEQFIIALSDLYRDFELHKIRQHKAETEIPRIVYSEYVGE